MKALILILFVSSCGSATDDNRSQSENVEMPKGPMVLEKKEASGPFETRRQMAYGTNICQLVDADQTCVVVGLETGLAGYTVTMEYASLKADPNIFTGRKTYGFVNDKDPVFEISVHGTPKDCKPMIHTEIRDDYVRLVHPGCGDGEIVLATWSK